MVRLVLFDIDGTLIRTGGAGVKAFAQVLAMEFKTPNGADHVSFAGRTDPSIVRELFSRYRIEATAKNFQRFFNSYVFWLDHLLRETEGRVLPGVQEMLHGLSSLPEPPVPGLLTGNIRLGAQIKLVQFGLWDQFKTGAFGDDHEDRNEIAAVARARGEELLRRKLRGEEILVVGDTPLDIACGKAIGAKVLAVATGGCRLGQLLEHNPTWAVPDLAQVCLQELCLN
jgi:phosphoglycolate phosphatase